MGRGKVIHLCKRIRTVRTGIKSGLGQFARQSNFVRTLLRGKYLGMRPRVHDALHSVLQTLEDEALSRVVCLDSGRNTNLQTRLATR